jgi:3-deoxy-D-manno-octulosonate 8-phosphate phosphatase (KDO 8-P phosphatase)
MVGKIELLILDVDGVLTDGRVFLSADDEPLKRFHVRDGSALKLWRQSGGKVAILSGRPGGVVERRAKELGIAEVRTGVADKLREYDRLLDAMACSDEAVAYVADDHPDLGPMGRCGFPVAVADAASAVKRAAAYVTRRRGGDGAVAEVIEHLLRRAGKWNPRETGG